MSIALWIMVGWYVVSVILMPLSVGKPRRPVTGGQAAVAAVMQLAIAAVLALIAMGALT